MRKNVLNTKLLLLALALSMQNNYYNQNFLFAANLFTEDVSFETGVQNFRYFRSERLIETVTDDAAHGQSSLQVDSRISWLQGRWSYTIQKDVDYVVSFYAKRVSGTGQLDFALIGVFDWQQIGQASFQLTEAWQRYSCQVRTDRAGTVLFPAFLPKGDLVFRLDAIQLETGREASQFCLSEPFSIYSTVGVGEIVNTPEIPQLTVRPKIRRLC